MKRAALALGLAAAVSSASASEATLPRVLVVMAPDQAQLAERVQSELDTMGFEISLRLERAPAAALAQLTRDADAIAGTNISVDGGAIECWVHDRTTGKTLTRRLARAGAPSENTLALYIVELLRASLLELQLPDAPRGDRQPTGSLLAAARVAPATPAPAPSMPAPASIPRTLPPEPTRRDRAQPPSASPPEPARVPIVGLEVGAGLLGGLPGPATVPTVVLGGGYFATRQLRIGGLAAIPLVRMRHSDDRGQSQTRVTLLGAEACVYPLAGRFQPFAGLAMLAALLDTQGTTDDMALRGIQSSAVSVGAALRAGLDVPLVDRLQARPQASLGVQHAYFSIDHAGREAARWGPLWWSIGVSLQAVLP